MLRLASFPSLWSTRLRPVPSPPCSLLSLLRGRSRLTDTTDSVSVSGSRFSWLLDTLGLHRWRQFPTSVRTQHQILRPPLRVGLDPVSLPSPQLTGRMEASSPRYHWSFLVAEGVTVEVREPVPSEPHGPREPPQAGDSLMTPARTVQGGKHGFTEQWFKRKDKEEVQKPRNAAASRKLKKCPKFLRHSPDKP